MNTLGSFLAAVETDEVETLFLVLAFGCLCGAAYTAYLRNGLATGLLIAVAVVAVIVGAD